MDYMALNFLLIRCNILCIGLVRSIFFNLFIKYFFKNLWLLHQVARVSYNRENISWISHVTWREDMTSEMFIHGVSILIDFLGNRSRTIICRKWNSSLLKKAIEVIYCKHEVNNKIKVILKWLYFIKNYCK